MRSLIALALLALPAAANAQIGMVEQTLARYDLGTLRPVGPRLTIGEPHTRPVLSPDGRRLAIGISAQPETPGAGRVGLLIVDRATMRPLHAVSLGVFAAAVVYPGVVAAVSHDSELVVVDPRSGRITERRPWRRLGCPLQGLTAGHHGVFVGTLSPGGNVDVTVVDADGTLHGTRVALGRATGPTCTGARAVVVGRRVMIAGPDAVAVLDSATRRVTRHAVSRLGAVRDAEAIPGGLAVVGDGGLTVIDRGSWRVRWRDADAESVTATRGVVVVTGHGTRGRRGGDGRVLWRRARRSTWLSEALRGRMFFEGNRRMLILDARTGEVVGRRPPVYTEIDFAGA